mgnify:CR=1 FL=1
MLKKKVVPKKKKAKKKPYFGIDVQEAIVRYNALDQETQQSKRNKIYQEEIHKAFDKLCENIINTFKFTYFDDGFEDVKNEVVSFLVMNIHKYDHTKGSKAFSYFSIVAKNYLILHNNANYKKYKSHDKIEALDIFSSKNPKYENDFDVMMDEMIEYFEANVCDMFKKKIDIDIAYSILELMKKRDEIENFNKKSLYILIREMTNVNTSQITSVVNVLKKHYKKISNQYHSVGHIPARQKSGSFF